MTMRFFVDFPLITGTELNLPPSAARHAQVLRVQPGDPLLLFDGTGRDWAAQVLQMGKQQVRVRVGAAHAVDKELALAVTLALVMPANERMDGLVEKACELGVAGVQPLMSERSVLRLVGERAQRKQAHWQAVAQAACEQCGRAKVPVIAPVMSLLAWLSSLESDPAQTRWLLSLQPGARRLSALAPATTRVCMLSGPEGGFSADEEQLALRCGFQPVDLGPRVLRADTAPLAVLAWLALR